jgi:putative acetyltransferase
MSDSREWTVRREMPEDASGIRLLVTESFPTPAEARLVDALRDAGRLTISCVALVGIRIVGHVAFSPVTATKLFAGVGLAPLSVAADHRRRGIGAALVRHGLAECAAAGWAWCVVLGDPAYYGRFGFRPAARFGLADEYGGGDAFGVLALAPGGIPDGAGLVRYAGEFAELG